MPRSGVAILAAMLMVAPLVAPAVAQGDEYVPESLWGVKDEVGLTLAREVFTNYGDRAFWQARPTGMGVDVALVDTGIDPSHPDLQDTLACDHCWKDFVNGRTDPYDDSGHGTHLAGIIAANGHFQPNPLNVYFPTGARGIATDADLIVAKAMNETGAGEDETVAEAIRWAMNPDGANNTGDEADILHLSVAVRRGASGPSSLDTGSETAQAVREAINAGVVVVMSAGNDGANRTAEPGSVPGVISVGGLDAQGDRLPFSNHGEGVDVFAPGVVVSTWPAGLDTEDGVEDGYHGLAGTSQAAPVVTGSIALAMDANPSLLSEQSATKVQHVESMLKASASNGASSAPRLDANAFLESQDTSTSMVAVPQVAFLGAVALLVLIVCVRWGWRALERHVEEHEAHAENGINGPASTGQGDDAGAVERLDSNPGEPLGGEESSRGLD